MKNVKAQRVTSAPPPLDSPDDLFLQVLHALEGEETHRRRVLTAGNGVQDVSFDSFGPDRWIERAKLGRIDAIPLLAIILHATRDVPNIAAERRIVEGWAARIRQAVEAGELTARDPVTLLPLGTLPDGWGWGWCVSVGDADAFVQGLGMAWTCSGIVAAIAEECTDLDTLAIERIPSRPAEQPAAPVSAPLPRQPYAPPPVAKGSAPSAPKPSGLLVTKGELLAGLKLDKNLWNARLSHSKGKGYGKHYHPARLQPTGPGNKRAAWDPVIFAELAAPRGVFGQERVVQRVVRFFETAGWSDYQDEIEGRLNAVMGEM